MRPGRGLRNWIARWRRYLLTWRSFSIGQAAWPVRKLSSALSA